MKHIWTAAFVGALALASLAANAQSTVRVRGTIVSLDGNVLAVKSRAGEDLRVQLSDNATVAVAKAVKFEDIKLGDFIASSTMRRPDGSVVALEVHYPPPTARAGMTPHDLQPGSTMNNANVAAIVGTPGKRELTFQFPDSSQKILVPEGTPIVRTVPGTRADLAPGEYVFIIAQSAAGKLSAERVQVSKDGVKPPQ